MQILNINNSYFLKQNDTATPIQLQILDSEGTPFPLDTATSIEVVIGNTVGRQLVKIPTLLEGIVGGLQFTLDDGDLLNVGDNRLEVHIYDAVGEKYVAPSKGFYKLRIQQALDSLGEEVTQYTLDYFLSEVTRSMESAREVVEQGLSIVPEMNAALEQTITATENANEATTQANNVAEVVSEFKNAESYLDTVQYVKNNIVEFNGSTFMARQDTLGNRPPLLDTEGKYNDYWYLAARKGDDGDATVTRYTQEFISTEGQTVFTLDHDYDQFQDRVDVVVGGVPQTDSYDETSSRTITFKEGLPANLKVVVKYFGKAIPLGTDLEQKVDGQTATLNNHAQTLSNHTNELTQVTEQLEQNEKLKPFSMTTKHLKQKPIISFIDDDARKSVYTLLKPIFDEKATKFNFCAYVDPIIGGDTTNFLSPSEMLEIQSAGNEVLSHGWLKDKMISSLDKSLWEKEFKDSKNYLQTLGLNVNSYVWQGGDYNQEALEMVSQYYHSAWAIDQGYGINKSKRDPLDQYKGHRFSLDNATLASAKAEVDKVASDGGWLVFMSHCWDTQWQTAGKQQDLRDLIDYIKSLSIDIVTVDEGLNIHGNIIDYGEVSLNRDYFKIDKQGTILNKGNRFYSEPENTVMIDTPPSFFRRNAITISYHNGATTATGFPKSSIGTIVTTKGLDGIVTQEWYPHYQTGIVKYVRRNVGNDTWGDFVRDVLRKPIVKSQSFPSILAGTATQVTIDISQYNLSSQDQIILNMSQPLPSGLILSWSQDGTTLRINAFNATTQTMNGATYSLYMSAIINE